MRISILTVSTSVATGARAADASGDALAELVTAPPLRAMVVQRSTVPDDQATISAQLADWADDDTCDVILTTGGTGLSPTDVTPEATGAILDRVAPGITEAMRAGTAGATPLAWLSRGVAGTRGRTLIINLPGSPKAVRECLAVVLPLLPHAVAILTAAVGQHDAPSGGATGQ